MWERVFAQGILRLTISQCTMCAFSIAPHPCVMHSCVGVHHVRFTEVRLGMIYVSFLAGCFLVRRFLG